MTLGKQQDIKTASQAIERLLEGNRWFRDGHRVYKDMVSAQSRGELVGGQHPYAAVLSCADSRVPTSHIFAAGLGDVFVCRNAGNIADDDILGSLEYAVEHLETPLVAVLGHSHCGAVGAAVRAVQTGECNDTPCIGGIVGRLAVAAAATQKEGQDLDDWIDAAARRNVQNQCRNIIAGSTLISQVVNDGAVEVVPLWYDLETGEVSQL